MTAAAATRTVDGLVLPRAVAGHPALELCNTRAGWGEPAPREYLTSYDHLVVWAASTGLLPPASARRLRRTAAGRGDLAATALAAAIALREDLYAVLTRPRPPRPALDRVTAAVQDAGTSTRIAWTRGALVVDDGAEDLRLPVRAVAGAVRGLVESGLAPHVRRCPGAGCGWLFLDEGRGRKWCVMALCGNREKVRRYAERHG